MLEPGRCGSHKTTKARLAVLQDDPGAIVKNMAALLLTLSARFSIGSIV
jgi:hypothetical protein